MIKPNSVVLWLFSAILIATSSFTSNVFANHPSGFHNQSIHYADVYERICVDTKSSTKWDQEDARYEIRESLVYNSTDRWHKLANDKVYFGFATGHCSDLNSSELSSIKMRVYVMDNTNSECGGPYSCVFHYQVMGNHGSYTDYGYEKVYLRSNDLTNVQDYIVNHEFGHTLGLRDGDGTCPGSIMHSADYGCSGYRPGFPTSKDQTSVTNLANSN